MKNKHKIYRNLNWNRPDGGSVYSIQNDKDLVVGHESWITLKDCDLRVQPKGNQRVRDEQRKNVHAYIQGYLLEIEDGPKFDEYKELGEAVEITYNPYKHNSFVRVDTGESIYKAKAVFTNPDSVFAII
jgi:hypothetical protein